MKLKARIFEKSIAQLDRENPVVPVAVEEVARLSCGHRDTGSTGPCISCHLRHLVKTYYAPDPVSDKKESQMKVKASAVASSGAVAAPKKKVPTGFMKNRPVVEGKTLKMNVSGTWVEIFKNNATKKLTDEQITEFMFKEFPDRKSKTFQYVGHWRNVYNKGNMTDGKIPSPLSVRFEKTVAAPKASSKKS